MIEVAYTQGEQLGLSVWCCDQAGPFTTTPYAGPSWSIQEHPLQQAHEYVRHGTAKILTLFHPSSGQVHVQGVTSTTNAVLHSWLKHELTAVLETLPEQAEPEQAEPEQAEPEQAEPEQAEPTDVAGRLPSWRCWQEGLTIKPTLPADLPPLRMLLVLDNLAGHKNAEFVCWLFSRGIMPLYTPLGGSWLNMAESIQRILKRRALLGQHPESPEQIMTWFAAAATHWNADPTPFEWAGKRQQRRERSRTRRHRLGGSAACTRRPIRRHRQHKLWPHPCQVTH